MLAEAREPQPEPPKPDTASLERLVASAIESTAAIGPARSSGTRRETKKPQADGGERAPPPPTRLTSAAAHSKPEPLAFTPTGTWATNRKACSKQGRSKGLLAARIDPKGAKAGSTACSFKNTQRDGRTWKIQAECSEDGDTWSANIRLTQQDDQLTWSSERGSARYVRCAG